MNKKREQNLPGFSLIELMILLAVMSILVGMVTLGFGFLRSNDTKQIAYGIENGLKTLKSKDMAGKDTLYLHVFVHDGKYYRTITNSVAPPAPGGEEKEIGNAGSISVKVIYDVKDEHDVRLADRTVTLSESGTSDVCIGMSKKDGTFLYQKVSGTNNSEAPREMHVTASGSGGTPYLVYMVTDTGKHYVEAQ